MRSAPEPEVINGCTAADGKGLAMIELEKAALRTASPRLIDKRALRAIAIEYFAPHGRGQVPRAAAWLSHAKSGNRIL